MTEKKDIKDFINKPFSKHSLDTLKILNQIRSRPNKNKYCLICIEPYKVWQLAKLTGKRGEPAKPIKNKYFTNLEKAERYVFKLRYKSLKKILK